MNGILKTSMVLLGLALFAACSNDSDEETTQQPPQPKSYPLTIEVTENPLVQDGEESSSRSNRAAITTTSTLTEFKLNYAYNTTCSTEDPVTASKETEGKWTSSGNWPEISGDNWKDVVVTWYAKTGGTLNYDGSNPYISFSTDEQSNKQHDLLVATAADTWNNSKGKLSFDFNHVCSALRLSVKKATNISDYTLTVSNIVLMNVVKVGKYYYNTSSWALSGEAKDRSNYTLYSASGMTLGSSSTDYVSLNGNFGTNEEPYLFLIPQTLTAWNASTNTTGAYISLTCTITKDATTVHNGEARIPFTKEFLKGKSYDVKINIGKNSLLKTDGTKIIND